MRNFFVLSRLIANFIMITCCISSLVSFPVDRNWRFIIVTLTTIIPFYLIFWFLFSYFSSLANEYIVRVFCIAFVCSSLPPPICLKLLIWPWGYNWARNFEILIVNSFLSDEIVCIYKNEKQRGERTPLKKSCLSRECGYTCTKI
jgi:hypothetical protein